MTRRIVPAAGDDANDRLLTSAEVAALLRVHPDTVRERAARGELAGRRDLFGRWRYLESDVRAYIEAQRVRKS